MNHSSLKLRPVRGQSSQIAQLSQKSDVDSLDSKSAGEIGVVIGCRIPRKFFWTSGIGESDITIHAGSYHLALKEAGIERYNIMVYSSIMPGIAIESPSKPTSEEIPHGSVMETITAVKSGVRGERLTAGIVYGWLYSRETGKKYGGLVCEYNGNDIEADAKDSLKRSLNELYTNGFSEEYDMKDIRIQTRSFVPKKKFGTAMVVIGFKDYVYPIVK
ncbi:MAG TPA: pyruvoyl-dependent arginine decarboxylase [Candidatus Nanoarchaeia archaeon]|nr:pyruvoyl-dependent arginine decarboxylase [Candidatus Nanoarchaeia archaeon]